MVMDDVNERRRRHFLLPISTKYCQYVWRHNWNVKLMRTREGRNKWGLTHKVH